MHKRQRPGSVLLKSTEEELIQIVCDDPGPMPNG
jgi:hypothetical protein